MVVLSELRYEVGQVLTPSITRVEFKLKSFEHERGEEKWYCFSVISALAILLTGKIEQIMDLGY